MKKLLYLKDDDLKQYIEKIFLIKHVFLTEEGEKLFNEIFSAQKKRIYQAFSASKANEVVSFDNVLKKIINGKI